MNLILKTCCLSGLLLCSISFTAFAQNRASAWIKIGSPTPGSGFNYGLETEASFSVSPIVEIYGGVRVANQYPSGLGSVKAGAIVFLDKSTRHWSCENMVCFSNYAPYPMNELFYKLSFAWETEHFRIDLGNAFALFTGSGVTKYHLFRPSFCFRGSIWEKDNPYNIDLFIRNFNRFEAHGSRGIEWGASLSASLAGKWRLFCEPYVFTAGNFNGTATFYNFNCLIGGAYIW